MILKKYISTKLLIRLGLLLAMVSAAIVFDMYHTQNDQIAKDIQKSSESENSNATHVFFCSPFNPVNLKVGGRIRIAGYKVYAVRSNFSNNIQPPGIPVYKSECTTVQNQTDVFLAVLILSRNSYSSPDDYPPVC
jgi:hypothetical protein